MKGYSKELMTYAKGLQRLVQVKTVTNIGDKEFAEFREVLKKEFPLIAQNTECVLVHNNALLYKWKGKSDKKPIVLVGHQDVVPAEDGEWKFPPYSGEISEGKVWGRGAMDCKGTLYAELQAIEELMEEGLVPEYDVYVASSDCEETFGPGSNKTKEYLRDKGVKPYMVLDEGGSIVKEVFPGLKCPYAVIGIYEKGQANIKFTARGKGGHSSMPPKNNPMARLGKLMAHFDKKNYFERVLSKEAKEMFVSLSENLSQPLKFMLKHVNIFGGLIKFILPRVSPFGQALMATTMIFTQASASNAPNVIPQEASVIANLRISQHQNTMACLEICKKVAKKFDVEAELMPSWNDASPIVDTQSEGFLYLKNCVKEYFPAIGVTPYIIMGGTDCRFYQDICDCAMRFSPIMLDKQQLEAMHASDENVGIEDLAEAVGFYKYVVKNLK